MKSSRKRKSPQPPIGTVFYEVGFKREKPSAPIIITWVYSGKVSYNGSKYYLLVEFGHWWNLVHGLKVPIKAEHGLKIRDLDQLYEGRETWGEVVRWVKKCGKDWRKAMKG